MIDIPANILTLLKSRQQIGPDRPVARVVFGGQPPGGTSLKNPATWTAWPTFVGRSGYTQTNGNMEETADKRAIISYYADDNLFTDEAGNTLTPIANIHTDNTVKKFGASSAALDGSYDGISVVDSESWNLANGWTIEFQLYLDELEVKSNYYALKTGMWGSTWIFMSTYADGVMKWTFWNGGFEYGFQDVEFTPEAGQFYHVAVCQDGEHWYLFIEGQQLAKTTPARMELSNPYNPLHIMGYEDHSPKAHIDEYRVSDIARYTAPFTPPTEPFEMDEHTVLLLLCDDPNLGKRVEIAYADSVREVLDQTKTFGQGTVLDIGEPFDSGYTSLARIDGRTCLGLAWVDQTNLLLKAEYWRDDDGNGTNFHRVGIISHNLQEGFYSSYYGLGASPITIPTRLPNGNLSVIVPRWFGTWNRGKQAFYSEDDGVTWIAGAHWCEYYVGTGVSFNPLIIGEDSFIVNSWGSSGGTEILKFTNSGANVSGHGWAGDWGTGWWANPCWVGWYNMGNVLYMSLPEADNTIVIRRYIGPEIITEVTVSTIANWEEVVRIGFSDGYTPECVFTETAQTLVLQHSIGDRISGAGTELTSNPLRPKRVVVSRTKGGASQLSVQFANTNGQYAPDPAGPWQFVMWPNNTVRAEIGYGTYLPQVFRGSIDDVDMDTPPQMISITARDRSKLMLDQMCQWTWDGTTYYDGAWASQDPEGIALTLFTMAGFAEADIVYDVTGITIPEFRFNQQTYADLLQKLAEMAGCEWYCDEDGKAYFKLVTYPEATPVYSFVAGVDIFSLGYRISDAEIYRWVVVTAQGPEDEGGNRETISVRVEWSAADYYGLPAHKTLYVTASDLVQDEAGCLEIANRMLTAMTTKPRQVNFVCVGIPNVQIGDCIQVTEASSTISEIYRVYDFEHQFDAEGSPVFATAIKCYWYAHG